MDELHQMADAVRKHDNEGNVEWAHQTEDGLLVRALQIIAEGTDNPSVVARIALSTQSEDNIRWYT